MATNWLVRLKESDNPRIRLICFPFGGAGAGVYWDWRSELADDVELFAIRLPGRESRVSEAFVTDAHIVVASIIREASELHRLSTVFYGHSMGAGLAYQTAMTLRDLERPPPTHLIVSGRMPPHRPYPGGWAHRSETELVAHLSKLGGLPDTILENRTLLSFYLRRIRADFLLNDDLFYGRAPKFDFPITVINGVDDPLVDDAGIAEWREHTTAQYRSFKVTGGHFFHQTNLAELIPIVLRAVECPPLPI
jgi:surfactin synthase thioesterase subunit